MLLKEQFLSVKRYASWTVSTLCWCPCAVLHDLIDMFCLFLSSSVESRDIESDHVNSRTESLICTPIKRTSLRYAYPIIHVYVTLKEIFILNSWVLLVKLKKSSKCELIQLLSNLKYLGKTWRAFHWDYNTQLTHFPRHNITPFVICSYSSKSYSYCVLTLKLPVQQ